MIETNLKKDIKYLEKTILGKWGYFFKNVGIWISGIGIITLFVVSFIIGNLSFSMNLLLGLLLMLFIFLGAVGALEHSTLDECETCDIALSIEQINFLKKNLTDYSFKELTKIVTEELKYLTIGNLIGFLKKINNQHELNIQLMKSYEIECQNKKARECQLQAILKP